LESLGSGSASAVGESAKDASASGISDKACHKGDRLIELIRGKVAVLLGIGSNNRLCFFSRLLIVGTANLELGRSHREKQPVPNSEFL